MVLENMTNLIRVSNDVHDHTYILSHTYILLQMYNYATHKNKQNNSGDDVDPNRK